MNQKQTVKINESQLKKIVEESVKKIFEEKVNVYNNLVDIEEKLWQIKESGLIAFTSPNPSSTELELKQCIEKADAYIYKAAKLYQSLYKN